MIRKTSPFGRNAGMRTFLLTCAVMGATIIIPIQERRILPMLRGSLRGKALLISILALLLSLFCLPGVFAAADGDSLLFVPGETSEYGEASIDWAPSSVQSSGISTFSLPLASWDPRGGGYLPSIRTQGSYGTCWAISGVTCAEIYAVKNSLLSSVNFSAWHLAYFSTHQSTDPLGNCSNDYNTSATYLVGGNLYSTIMTFASWRGPADEGATGSRYENLTSSASLDASTAYKAELYLKNAYMLAAATSADRSVLKQMILDQGAVTACIYSDNSYYNYPSDGDANYYQSFSTSSNHEVTIVGWDDNYPADSFKNTPEGDGAFLCMNSWGSSWGDGGYFWLSYYDKSLVNNACAVYEYTSASTYDHNYQYDGCVVPGARYLSSWGSEAYYANVFTATGNSSGGEQLKAVSTFSNNTQVPYDLYIYTDLQDPADPTSGTLAYSSSGTFTYVGFYTVQITPVDLWEGETFSVVFRIKSSNGKLSVPTCYTESSWYSVNEVLAGQSFFSGNGSSWFDGMATSSGGVSLSQANVRIKAYTSNVSRSVTVSLDPNGGTVGTTSLTPLFGAAYGELPTPTRTNWTFLGWFTEKEGGEQVTSGTIVTSTEDRTLYAHWQSNWTDGRFTDVSSSSWYANEVKYCWERGIFLGLTDTTFGPLAFATRGQIVTVLYRLAGSPDISGNPPFDDVSPSAYYAKAITWASQNNIALGSDDDGNGIYSFRPDENVTRQDFLCFLYRYAKWAGVSTGGGDISAFPDAGSVSSYALDAEQWSVGCGLQIGSDGQLMPRSSITRAEVATFLSRYDQQF